MSVVEPRIEISDISADISAIYWISGLIETIFDTENRLQEKSRKIGEYRRYFGEISDFDRNIGRNIGGWETRARGNFFGFFWEIYRRYIGNIGDISEISVKISEIYRDISGYIGIYRKYIQMTRFEILT